MIVGGVSPASDLARALLLQGRVDFLHTNVRAWLAGLSPAHDGVCRLRLGNGIDALPEHPFAPRTLGRA